MEKGRKKVKEDRQKEGDGVQKVRDESDMRGHVLRGQTIPFLLKTLPPRPPLGSPDRVVPNVILTAQ